MSRTQLILAHQAGHLVWLLILLAGLYAVSRVEGFADGELLGISSTGWVFVSVANAIIHQVFVWFCWRTELHAGLLTHLLGGSAFLWYAAVFTVLILARPVLITALAISNAHTLPSNPWVMSTIGVVLAVPGVYLVYSIKRYFGFKRAYGMDHFDPGYRSLPLVREGIFRFSSNAMYDFGFLLLWLPGLFLQSVAALAVALFSHLYIWGHYLFTERPDMRIIYGTEQTRITS
ncbi:MAG: methyltransferase [Planctomycetota bacterium]|jgi:hypothetical protein